MSRPSPETSAEIVRLFFAEHWKVGTIATQLGLHPDVVRGVIGLGGGGDADAAETKPRLVFSARQK